VVLRVALGHKRERAQEQNDCNETAHGEYLKVKSQMRNSILARREVAVIYWRTHDYSLDAPHFSAISGSLMTE
jgi:hypothetical protein